MLDVALGLILAVRERLGATTNQDNDCSVRGSHWANSGQSLWAKKRRKGKGLVITQYAREMTKTIAYSLQRSWDLEEAPVFMDVSWHWLEFPAVIEAQTFLSPILFYFCNTIGCLHTTQQCCAERYVTVEINNGATEGSRFKVQTSKVSS